MGPDSEFISCAADTIFASSAHSAIIAAGFSPGYPSADTVVLSSVPTSTADVLLGAGDTVFGGAGHLVLTFTTGLPAVFIPGTGQTDVLNNPTGIGIALAGATAQHTTGGTVEHLPNGGTVTLWAAGAVS